MFRLEGRRALITGASGGIGSEIARVLHRHGAIVGISGTRVDSLEALARELSDTEFDGELVGEAGITESARRVHVLPGRLDTNEGPQKLMEDAENAMGGIDILVNNAGLTRDGLVVRLKDEDWEAVLRVNLTATFKLCREGVRGMMRRRWGRIINISSVVGTSGNAGQANYAATKAGLEGFGRSLALEVASRGVTVNAIAPGFIDTSMTQVLSEEQKGKLLTAIPLGRMGCPADVASGVAFFASEESAYVTGHTLHINGGMIMG